MILIVSNNEMDTETDYVCRWLLKKKASFLRLNMDDFIRKSSLFGQDYFIQEDNKYYYTDFSKIWVRRKLNRLPINFRDTSFDEKSNADINVFQQGEWDKFMRFFLSHFPPEKMINKVEGYFLSKVEQLRLANEIGMNPPASFFSNDLNLLPTAKNHFIHKPAGNLGYLQKKDGVYAAFTEVLHEEASFERLLPSFFQEKLEGEYEIRVLYCNKEVFACGMIKSDEEENVDVKKQDSVRYSVVKLPEAYQNKIRKFMDTVGFKVGVLDVIKSKEDYHFIEMNPIGKFLFYSEIGNFGMDEKIANILLN